ncbi:ScbR family autoregulator-binding transcription factor [Streptomyces sp. NPDC046985]|uniref:ScbR family autoregulator-binding transcription factor n=1 Tax=Streptomyces sp. NPDC046985 TaxID=3155377 RepID=UPI0034115B11
MRTREALIRSAAEAVGRDGFTAASLADVSARAGVSYGALHFHFAGKAALAEAVGAAALERLAALLGPAAPGAGSRLQRLVDVTHALTRGLASDPVLRAGFALCADAAWAPAADPRAHWRRWVEDLLREAAERGELRPAARPEGIATTVVGATAGFETLGARDAAWLAPRTIARFWELLLPALASPELLARLDARGAPEA